MTSLMVASPERPLAYAQAKQARFLDELMDFIRFPSVAAQPAHKQDLRACAAWVAAHLRTVGFHCTSLLETAGHPIVLANWLRAPGRPTLLFYGHYDVQPAEPLDVWNSPPFEPQIRGGYVYGRGASDDKGQLFTQIRALECWLRTEGRLPVNVICLLEGEEEIGSPNLGAFLAKSRDFLRVDCAVVSDTRMASPGHPAITYGLRGALSAELYLRGLKRDLHSGQFGGAIHNPLQALCEMIAALHDQEGRVAIPGFYDCVRLVSLRERASLARAAPRDTKFLSEAGASEAWGEPGYSLYERATLRPALTVNGITGGYQGPGEKAVIPAQARAKLNLRLVPDQDPREIAELLRRHLARLAPRGMSCSVHVQSLVKPALIDPRHPVIGAAAVAYERAFGVAPVLLRSGGTIPVVSLVKEILGAPTVLMGFGLPEDNIHAANERFRLQNFFAGIATMIWFLAELNHL